MFAVLFASCLSQENNCPTANNGTCEELTLCALGTDSVDCDALCKERPWSVEIAGACAHDYNGLEPKNLRSEGIGSNGTGGKTGTFDSVVTVRGSRADVFVDRHYRTYVPRRYNPERPTPLLFVLGGFTVDMYWLAEFTELNRLADREEVILVYGHPEWREFGDYDVFSWYTYNQAFEGDWAENPDIQYMENILQDLQVLYNIDLSRVYVSGHSRGGALSMIAAFERPDIFAGFCSQAGFSDPNDYNVRIAEVGLSHRPASVLIHGEDDPDVRVRESDEIHFLFEELNWEYGEDWLYERIPNATHEWQSQYNQKFWEFLFERSNPLVEP